VAPRLRATGLPYIASPEIMSSGNAQHIGTEYNRFIIIIQVHRFGVTIATRHGGTSRAATLSTLFMLHLKASIRSTKTLRQRNDEVTGLQSTGTLLGHGLVRVVHHSQLFGCDTSCIWHDTPGQYIECTCKLITAKSSEETIAWQQYKS
jgi:hypothetical protein